MWSRKNWNHLRNLFKKELNTLFQKPMEVIIELTHRCNLKCQMCGVWRKNSQTSREELTREDWQSFILAARGLGVKRIDFTGGEPVLRPDLRELTALVKSLDLECGFFTNGTLIDTHIAEWIVENKIDAVHFSIDGLASVDDAIRGKEGSFKLAEQGLRKLIEIKRRKEVFYPQIDIHCTVSRLNAGEVLNMAEWAEKEGVSFAFQIFSELKVDSGTEEEKIEMYSPKRYLPLNSSLHLDSKQVRQLKEEIRTLPPTISTRLFLAQSDKDIVNGCFPIKRCYVSRDYIFVDPYGNIFPCTNFDNLLMGNIKEENLFKIWQGEKYRRFRKQLRSDLFPSCRHCCHLAHNLTIWQVLKLFFGKKL